MNPLVQSLYREFPRHTSPTDAEKSIAKVLKQAQKEWGVGMLEAHTRLLKQVTLYAKHRAYMIASGQSEKKYTPEPARWFNRGSWKEDASEWEMPPEKHPGEEFCSHHWHDINLAYGVPWEDKRYWQDTWDLTWHNLPAPIRSDLQHQWKP